MNQTNTESGTNMDANYTGTATTISSVDVGTGRTDEPILQDNSVCKADWVDVSDAEPATESLPIKKVDPIIGSSRINRNGPCPCGSGKKYKKCCINKEAEHD